MKWTVHGERMVYTSPWVNLALADIELPGGERFEHHVVRMPAEASGVVVHDASRGLLLLWRHRFTTDTWGWELPAGRVDPGETPEQAGAREVLEETGWRPGPVRRLFSYFPANGTSDLTFNVFLAQGAEYIGEPEDPYESERVEWVALDAVRAAVRRGQVHDGMSLTGLTWFLAFGAA